MSDMPEEYGEKEHISVKFFVAGVVLGFVLCGILLWTAMTYGRSAAAAQAPPFIFHLITKVSSSKLELIAGSSRGAVVAGFNVSSSSSKAVSLVKAGFGDGGKYFVIQIKSLAINTTVSKILGSGILKAVVKHDGKVIATGELKITSPSPGTTVYKIPLKWVAGKPELGQVTSVYVYYIK